MKIIKDNSKKEHKVVCNHCKSKFSFNFKEDVVLNAGLKFVKCPVCENHNGLIKFGFKYSTY